MQLSWLPIEMSAVRNVIGANMAFRRDVFNEVGDFNGGIGRVGDKPVGCEETELCIRLRQRWPHASIRFQPAANVRHKVPDSRARFGISDHDALPKAARRRWLRRASALPMAWKQNAHTR